MEEGSDKTWLVDELLYSKGGIALFGVLLEIDVEGGEVTW